MNVITGGRNSGKTYELIKRAAEKHGIIAVGNREQEDCFTKFYIPEMVDKGIIPEDHDILVITLETLLKMPGMCRPIAEREVFIDELDLVLTIMLDRKNLSLNTAVIGRKEYTNWTECDYKEGD